VPHNTGIYNLSTHFPWVGVRTAHVDSAHVEYARGLANPIAIKVGPDTTPDELVRLTEVLSPQNKPGRITLITRLGSLRVTDHLPRLVRAVAAEGRRVIWCCDPMHGNTEITAKGVKTRRFENIMSELTQAFEIHNSLGSRLNGVHIEVTGDDVTECVGGARGLRESDLGRSYKSAVDPRLNAEQALELAFEIVRQIQRDRQSA
jgi:3-deoxy-7-phosphoheptulonate synthase